MVIRWGYTGIYDQQDIMIRVCQNPTCISLYWLLGIPIIDAFNPQYIERYNGIIL